MGTNAYGYAYDSIGNRLTFAISNQTFEITHYAANALNQLVRRSLGEGGYTNEYAYDADGNLLSYAGWSFSWDAENRLVAASNGTTVVSNAYDYMSRRVSKSVNGSARQFLYDGWAMVREVTAGETNDYVYGLDLSGSLQGAGTIGGILSCVHRSSLAVHYFFYDGNGNVTDLADAGGSTAAHYEYDPYGNTSAMTGAAATNNPFRFSTKYLDAETALYYYGLRYYSANLARWASRDPQGEDACPLLTGFCWNAPVTRYDPLGERCPRWLTPDGAGGYRDVSDVNDIRIVNRPNVVFPHGAFPLPEGTAYNDNGCVNIRIVLTIEMYGRPLEENNSGQVVYYDPHRPLGSSMDRGNLFAARRAAIIAHERGHAQAFLEWRAFIDNNLSASCGGPATSLELLSAQLGVDCALGAVWISPQLIQRSVGLSNQATVEAHRPPSYSPTASVTGFTLAWKKN